MGSFGESALSASLIRCAGSGSLGFGAVGLRNTALEAWAFDNDRKLIENARVHGLPSPLRDGLSSDAMHWSPEPSGSLPPDTAELTGAAVMAQTAEIDALIDSMHDLL